jgi:hypothetical protein
MPCPILANPNVYPLHMSLVVSPTEGSCVVSRLALYTRSISADYCVLCVCVAGIAA